MRLHISRTVRGAALWIALLFRLGGPDIASADAGRPSALGLSTNEELITGLFTDLDLEDPLEVFGYVFDRLADRVVVYPSEGYYYFRFPMRGVTVKGALHLSAHRRDEGVLSMGYTGEFEDRPHGETILTDGRALDLTREHGLELIRRDDFRYDATFKGRTIRFELFDPRLETPPPGTLAAGEEYVCTSLDESGLFFDLVRHRHSAKLYWVLNQYRFVPEALLLRDGLAVGARTGFVFFLDDEHKRKILVGVRADEVAFNSWYDGPFDQLPDTYVNAGALELGPILAAHRGIDPREVDRYGHYLALPGVRIPVAPYAFYDRWEDLDVLRDLLDGSLPPDSLRLALTVERGRDLLSRMAGEAP